MSGKLFGLEKIYTYIKSTFTLLKCIKAMSCRKFKSLLKRSLRYSTCAADVASVFPAVPRFHSHTNYDEREKLSATYELFLTLP